MNKRSARLIRRGILLARMDINILICIQNLKGSTDIDVEDYAKFATYPKNKLSRKAYKRTMDREADAVAALRHRLEDQL